MTEKLDMKYVEDNIRRLMSRHDLTIREFADDAEVSYRCIKSILEGINKPNLGTVIKIANTFDVSIDALLRKEL